MRDRKRSYELNGQESEALATIGAFRVGQTDNRNRRRAPLSRMIQRLMPEMRELARPIIERSDGALCLRQVRGQMVEGNRAREPVCDCRPPYPAGSFTPRVSLFGEALCGARLSWRICGTRRAIGR